MSDPVKIYRLHIQRMLEFARRRLENTSGYHSSYDRTYWTAAINTHKSDLNTFESLFGKGGEDNVKTGEQQDVPVTEESEGPSDSSKMGIEGSNVVEYAVLVAFIAGCAVFAISLFKTLFQ